MASAPTVIERLDSTYYGLRMTADEFLQLPDDGFNYELINGVVVMSPSPTPSHQTVMLEIASQISWYLRDHAVGRVFAEVDVCLGSGPAGGDLVYRPEVIFVRAERSPRMPPRITGAPDLVVEVISQGSRRYDSETKKDDYERYGVGEYWLIDPARKAMTFYRLVEDRFVEVIPQADTFASEAVPGFVLDLKRVREAFELW